LEKPSSGLEKLFGGLNFRSRPSARRALASAPSPAGGRVAVARRGNEAEHEVIVYCKDHPDEKIIDAIGVLFKDIRAEMGVKMK
jgi:hypothetical protein